MVYKPYVKTRIFIKHWSVIKACHPAVGSRTLMRCFSFSCVWQAVPPPSWNADRAHPATAGPRTAPPRADPQRRSQPKTQMPNVTPSKLLIWSLLPLGGQRWYCHKRDSRRDYHGSFITKGKLSVRRESGQQTAYVKQPKWIKLQKGDRKK